MDHDPQLIEGSPNEIVVRDRIDECPYFPERRARMPLRLPVRVLSPEETDASLARGDRRHGRFLYRTRCPACRACEPLRLDASFPLRRRHRRVLARGDRELTLELGEPSADEERVDLYRRHKRGRGLGEPGIGDDSDYFLFLVDRCVDAFEMRLRHEGKLVTVAVVDRGEDALSAVYCSFDPELPQLSLGTYAILKQLELARAEGRRHLYLGLYIAAHPHMRYKGGFLPHERLVDGAWRRFERSAEQPEP